MRYSVSTAAASPRASRRGHHGQGHRTAADASTTTPGVGRLPPLAVLFGAGALLSLVLSLLCASVFWTTTNVTETTGVGVGGEVSTPHSPRNERRIIVASDGSNNARRSVSGRLGDAKDGEGDEDPCSPRSLEAEYDRVNSHRTQGLSPESLRRSRAWVGNEERLARVASTLVSRDRPVTVIVCGGSISMGHGLADPSDNRYSARLESWMNEFYPVRRANGSEAGGSGEEGEVKPKTKRQKMNKRGDTHRHRVINMGVHGADMCAMAKRINFLLEDLDAEYGVPDPDMFLLEFGVNDYQGQDHLMHLDHKTDVFFDGFRDVALCAEVVVNKLLRLPHNRKPAVAFLEFRTGILPRRTAQLLHVGVAMHYEVPVISYSEAVFPQYLRLVSMLNQSQSFSAPWSNSTELVYPSSSGADDRDSYTSSVLLPYPYGCSPCRADDIGPQFRPMGCKSVCVLMDRSGVKCVDEKKKPPPVGRQPCYVPVFAHDAVHPSRVGHAIARDLIVHALTSTARDRGICGRDGSRHPRDASSAAASASAAAPHLQHQPHVLPTTGWLMDSPRALLDMGDFVLVNDTMRMYTRWDRLIPTTMTSGWSYYNDARPPSDKPGWIATSKAGNESIRFDLDLPPSRSDGTGRRDRGRGGGCYAVYLAVLRSYVGMGRFTVTLEDVRTGRVTSLDADGLWGPRISVWSDIRVTPDDDVTSSPACTGRCTVTVTTHTEVKGRDGNKVKVLTLSARPCSMGE